MVKKDFKSTSAVSKFISSRTDEEEVQVTPDTSNTQNERDTPITPTAYDTHDIHAGEDKTRKQKHPRINMAFYGKNHEYLEYISRLSGVSITQYVNDLIDKDRAINQAKVDQAREILKG